jgi:hypothetical protein
MDKLPNSMTYKDFSYRTSLLLDFVRRDNEDASGPPGPGPLRRTMSTKANMPSSVHGNDVFEKWGKGSKKKSAASAHNLTSQSADMHSSSHI